MNNNINIKELLRKLNIDKKTGLIIVVGIILMMLLFISEIDFESEKKDEKTTISDEEYCNYLENKIKLFIENINEIKEIKVAFKY